VACVGDRLTAVLTVATFSPADRRDDDVPGELWVCTSRRHQQEQTYCVRMYGHYINRTITTRCHLGVQTPRSTQPSIPPGQVNQALACLAGVKVGHAHLCRVAGNTVWCHKAGDAP